MSSERGRGSSISHLIWLRRFVGRSEGRVEGVRDMPVAVQREGVVSDPADNEGGGFWIFRDFLVRRRLSRRTRRTGINESSGLFFCGEVIELFVPLHLVSL